MLALSIWTWQHVFRGMQFLVSTCCRGCCGERLMERLMTRWCFRRAETLHFNNWSSSVLEGRTWNFATGTQKIHRGKLNGTECAKYETDFFDLRLGRAPRRRGPGHGCFISQHRHSHLRRPPSG